MPKYYFFKTILEKGKNRLRPLPGQVSSDGTTIIESLNTQVAAGGKKLREAYPIGTVFCSTMCELAASGGSPYYSAGDIYPISEDNEYFSGMPMPTDDMLEAYKAFKDRTVPKEQAQVLGSAIHFIFRDEDGKFKKHCISFPTYACVYLCVVCYGHVEFWQDRENARRYYESAAGDSEGAERERYENIVLDIANGNHFCFDEPRYEKNAETLNALAQCGRVSIYANPLGTRDFGTKIFTSALPVKS